MFEDPRVPECVEWVGNVKVTIYSMQLYEACKDCYPDDPDKSFVSNGSQAKPKKPSNFVKQKSASRWNWTKKLEKPLGGKI